jgi:hypothetical protein
VKFSITIGDFHFLNPFLNTDCTNLWLNTAYCVQAVGTITTYPSYPTTPAGNMTAQPYTLTSEAFTTTTWISVPEPIATFTVTTAYPFAPGTWTNCTDYKNRTAKPQVFDQWRQAGTSVDLFPEDYYCNITASGWGLPLNTFLSWNPSLVNGNATGNCTLLPQYNYCVLAGSRKLLSSSPFKHTPLIASY